MLVFTGDNGLASNGLVAMSTELLVSIVNAHGARLRVIVLNGCKTSDAAQALLLQCPGVQLCICWSTAVHSEAASIFATALANMLDDDGNDDLATVSAAFHAAKAAVLERLQMGRLRGDGLIGTPLYAFLDPEDECTTHQECPCASKCHACPCVPVRSEGLSLEVVSC